MIASFAAMAVSVGMRSEDMSMCGYECEYRYAFVRFPSASAMATAWITMGELVLALLSYS